MPYSKPWIGEKGKIFTGNPWVKLPSNSEGLSCEFSHHPILRYSKPDEIPLGLVGIKKKQHIPIIYPHQKQWGLISYPHHEISSGIVHHGI